MLLRSQATQSRYKTVDDAEFFVKTARKSAAKVLLWLIASESSLSARLSEKSLPDQSYIPRTFLPSACLWSS
jgi:hypothetical protein